MRVAAIHAGQGEFRIDWADLEKFKPAKGESFVVDIARRRNVGHHRKGMALLTAMWENQDRFEGIEFDPFRKWVMYQGGFFKTYFVGEKEFTEADSLRFDKMDQAEFERVYQMIMTVAMRELDQKWVTTFG